MESTHPKEPCTSLFPEEPGSGEAGDLALIVGENLRKLRVERALTLKQLASASGVSAALLGDLELGRSYPTINVLRKIARTLGVTFAMLTQPRDQPH